MKIPYGRQSISQADVNAVLKVLNSDWLTQGPSIESFERAAMHHSGATFACAVNSATSALHLACLALELQDGDWLWTAPNTFVASANCALYCGARVDFVDVDPSTFNMCPEKLEEKLQAAEKVGKLPKVVVPVHFAGLSCDMERIRKLSLKYGFKIIEDASHAVGGSYLEHPVGSCHYSDITILSFHPVKIITTGEGGMALTNNPHLASRMSLLRSHGITKDLASMSGNIDGDWSYQQIELGFNYRMTDLQAALGVSQFRRLTKFVSARHELAERYTGKLTDFPVSIQKQSDRIYSAYHLFVINFQDEIHIKKRQLIFNHLRNAGIGVNVHYIPVHTQPYYKAMGFDWGDFPISERYYQSALSLPMFSDLTFDEQDYVVNELRESLSI
ncbi:UDP-4-amino-4,6-dideoxy-N-acetyl-beta-L-altrosamine transaminase [Porticoccaceae bacterium]|nr:UDP-4-amino-4,6-dideoxy-N-acetyl-beta-L-altrosamine transaminase [Porticoccaceae bacterium]MDA9565717.1 UDP-4-amino-4,6-dideoxy-N-acetyl-beta-L-altrosamine transaminase [Porticoccaceae bacterium]